ncbi:hypothetical protein J4Q44_G00095040, partial [Coregonus suidteri]
ALEIGPSSRVGIPSWITVPSRSHFFPRVPSCLERTDVGVWRFLSFEFPVVWNPATVVLNSWITNSIPYLRK